MASHFPHERIASDAGGEMHDRSYPHASTSQTTRYDRNDDPPLEDNDTGIPTDDSDMEVEPEDYTEDPDERIRNPVLYISKLWRKVSPQGPIYHCFRDPNRRQYSATLHLVFPPDIEPPSKRSAKKAVAEVALTRHIEDSAKRSIASSDRIGTESEPKFRPRPGPKRDEQFNRVEDLSQQEEYTAMQAQNPVTALNLAVQRYCVESPSQALIFQHNSIPHPVANYRIHGCKLTVRITPDLQETYSLRPQYTSAKIAKEATTRLALQEGVITLLKLHNSYTSRVCRQMGLPVPLNVQDHDPIHEENTAGMLGQLVQDVTRSPTAMQCGYSSKVREGAEYHGAVLTIDMRDGEQKLYRLEPCTKSKKEAKETVCRLAVKSGIREELLVQKRLIEATKTALNRLNTPDAASGSSMAPKAGSVPPDEADYLDNAVAYLNLSLQAFTGKSDALSFEFTELGPRSALGRGMGTRFGCNLTVFLPHGESRQFPVEPEFPSKKLAKESAAKLAVKLGVVELAKQLKAGGPSAVPSSSSQIRARNAGYPVFQGSAAEASAASFTRPDAGPYAAPVNSRASTIPHLETSTADIEMQSPPPYIDTRRAVTKQGNSVTSPHVRAENPESENTDRQRYLPQSFTTLFVSSSEGTSSGLSSKRSTPWHSNKGTYIPRPEPGPSEEGALSNDIRDLPVASTSSSSARQSAQEEGDRTRSNLPPIDNTMPCDSTRALPSTNPLIARQGYLPRPTDNSTGRLQGDISVDHASAVQNKLSDRQAESIGQSLVPRLDLSKPQSMAEQVHVRTLQDRLTARFGLSGRSCAQYSTKQSRESGLWSASLHLTIPGHEPLMATVEPRYPNQRMAEEGVAQRAIYDLGAIAIIDAHGRTAPASETAGTSQGQDNAQSDPPAAARDEFSQPVSYLNQVCQVLLSTDLSDLPKYELTKKGSGSLYGAILTIKTEPVSIYKTDMIYAGKAAAKEAVSRQALEAGIIQKLKDTMIYRRTAGASTGASSTPASTSASVTTADVPSSSAAAASSVPPAEVRFSERLDEYCRATNRPLPQWTVTTEGITNEALDVSVKIANETFQIDGSKKKKGDARENLAKMVLKHIRKRDEIASADQQTTTVV